MTEKIKKYNGREECPCVPISECEWTRKLQAQSDRLPTRNRLRKKVVQLIRDSVCDYRTKTIHCCSQKGAESSEMNSLDSEPRKTLVMILYILKFHT